MNYKRVWSVYFSATGTTSKVCDTVAKALVGVSGAKFCQYDFTLPKARESFPNLDKDDLVVFAVPTYAGRVPNVLLKYLKTIKGNDALAIPVVTFGNRNCDNSLLELRDLLENTGFHTISAIASSCEHSFSYDLGKGRPDTMDIMEIRNFTLKIYNKICALTEYPLPPTVPGISENYGGYYQPQDRNGTHIDIRKVTPKVLDTCTNCGLCADICPMGSIPKDDVSKMQGICIKCCACYKKCPQQARYFDDEGYLYHKTELEELYERRANNKFFL